MINGHYDLGLELLERGADPNTANYPSGITPLYAVINTRWASKSRYPQQRAFEQQESSHVETMRALLEAGADVNARLTMDYWFLAYNFGGIGVNTWGATPFWRAAHGLDIPAMKLLVEYGADPHMPTKAPAGNLYVGLEIEAPEDQTSPVFRPFRRAAPAPIRFMRRPGTPAKARDAPATSTGTFQTDGCQR